MARVAYRAVFARRHHPHAFACAVLNHHGGLYPLRTVAADLVRAGVALRGPNVETSELACVATVANVRIGLGALKFVTHRTKLRLLEDRAARGPFRTLADFEQRLSLGRRELSTFVLSGACDALEPLSNGTYPFAHEAFLAGFPPARIQVRAKTRPEHLELYSDLVRVKNELKFLEMHPSHHPMALLRQEAMRAGCITVQDVYARGAERARLAVIVAAVRRVRTTAERIAQFVTFEDETGLVEALVASPIYERLRDPIRTPGPYLVEAAIAEKDGNVALYVDAARPFYLRERPYAA
jgi:DNA polymerase III alpha subunit